MILDASALLAYLREEEGADVVSEALMAGVTLSVVNLAEVLSRRTAAGQDPQAGLDGLVRSGLLGQRIRMAEVTTEDAVDIARLRPLTRHVGLSLADRACIALARRTGEAVLTADSAWSQVQVGVEVRQIR